MSSVYIRNRLKTELTTQFPSEKFIDLTAAYQDISDLLSENTVSRTSPWVGLDFVANDEVPITVGSGNSQGKYRETGVMMVHVVDIAKIGVGASILSRSELMRNFLRGQRFDRIIIESVTPTNFSKGATLDFEAGFTSGTFMVSFFADLDL
jgi:hypothetical protein